MAPRTRQDTVQKLKFKDKLVKSGLSTDVLLKKIKTLHAELSQMDQDLVDRESLSTIRKELISTSILLHKDKGVKAYAACCLADLLRLYAPDAPYTAHELRDIFQFFLRQISGGLKGADVPYASQYYYLLDSLATIKSVVLVCDLPQADELMTDLFRDFFDIARQHELAKNVQLFMSDIMVAILEEAHSVPVELLEQLLAQFMQKNPRVDHPVYRMAVDVCSRTAERLQRNVCQYFTDLILSQPDTSEDDMEQIRSAHDLIKALNKGCPTLLLNVVPPLEEELRVDRLQLRTLATQVLGEMFAEPKSGVELSRKYPSAWQCWLQRKSDKASIVRLAFIEACKGMILGNLVDLRVEIEDALKAKLLDPDDRVRAATCRVYGQIDYESALHHVSVDQLQEVGERCMDKKRTVRVEALSCLGKLYHAAYFEIESNDPLAVKQFSWIPQAIMKAAIASTDVKADVEYVLHQYLLPLPAKVEKQEDETAWADQFLHLARQLDERGLNTLLCMTNLKTSRPSAYEKFIECCKKNNGGIIDQNEEEITRTLGRAVQLLSTSFGEPSVASEALNAFAKANESRLYKLALACMDPLSDLKTVVKSMNEFLRRIEQAIPSALETMTVFIRRASFCLINQSIIPALIKRLQKDKSGQDNADSSDDPALPSSSEPQSQTQTQTESQIQATTALQESTRAMLVDISQSVLAYISKNCPVLYTPHVTELSRAIYDDKSLSPRVAEVGLQSFAAVVKADPALAPSDKRTVDRLAAMAKEHNIKLAKYAARILAHYKNRVDLCTSIVQDLADALHAKTTYRRVAAHLSALAQFALTMPDAFETRGDDVTQWLTKTVLVVECPPPDDYPMDTEWIDDGDMTQLMRSKLLALKVLTNRCLGHAGAPHALEVAEAVVKLFMRLIDNEGSLEPGINDDPRIKGRLRLFAANCLLKLATVPSYCKVVMTRLPTLAIVVQDTCFNIRFVFLTKVITLLASRKLDPRFNVIPFMTAHDPEKEIRDMGRHYVNTYYHRAPKEVRVSNFEMIFVRFLHLLAHHPDFTHTGVGQLSDQAKYVEFYIDVMASAENVSLLYHLAARAKSVRDSESDAFNERLWIMAELAQGIIKTRAKSQTWPLAMYPGKLKLPGDIFRPHTSIEEANKVMTRAHLPDEATAILQGIGKHWKSPSKPQPTKSARKRKDTSGKASATAKSKRPRKRKDESDTEGDESSAAGTEAEDDVHMKSASEAEDNKENDKENESGKEESSPKLRRSGRKKAKAKAKTGSKR